MKTYDIIKFGLNSLTHRKLRSWLTVLGIVIGVASMVALISVGQGAQAQVQSRLGTLGADIFTISPGGSRAQGGAGVFGGGSGFGGSSSTANLTEDDVRVVKATTGILYVDGIVSDRGKISFLGSSGNINIDGVDASVWRYMDNTGLDSGRYLSLSDADGVVLGNRIATQMFSQEITVNSKVTIEGKVFTVVGILKTGGQSDGTAFITKETARTLLNQPGKKVSSISVKVVDSSQVETVANATADRLDITRHVQQGKQDFTITTAQSVQSQISSITGTFTLFLTAIASISLLVGAIGISNTMFTSVMERTRQIGILKSLGATDGEVMKIFVAEASLIGLLGGVLGVLAGISAAGFISELGLRIGFQGAFTAMIDPGLIAMAILFSVVIGAVSGIFPARRAANMQPVEALRYE